MDVEDICRNMLILAGNTCELLSYEDFIVDPNFDAIVKRSDGSWFMIASDNPDKYVEYYDFFNTSPTQELKEMYPYCDGKWRGLTVCTDNYIYPNTAYTDNEQSLIAATLYYLKEWSNQ